MILSDILDFSLTLVPNPKTTVCYERKCHLIGKARYAYRCEIKTLKDSDWDSAQADVPPTGDSRAASGCLCVCLGARPDSHCSDRCAPWPSKHKQCHCWAWMGNSASPGAGDDGMSSCLKWNLLLKDARVSEFSSSAWKIRRVTYSYKTKPNKWNNTLENQPWIEVSDQHGDSRSYTFFWVSGGRVLIRTIC